MFARCYIDEADVLLVGGLAPRSLPHSVAVGDVEMVAHIDTLKQKVESALTIRQVQLSLAELFSHLLALQCLLSHGTTDSEDGETGDVVDGLDTTAVGGYPELES